MSAVGRIRIPSPAIGTTFAVALAEDQSSNAGAADELDRERRLVSSAISGDKILLLELIRYATPRLTREITSRLGIVWWRRRGSLAHDVEEIRQDAFVALFKDGAKLLREWDRDRSLLNYFAGIARNVTLAWVRKQPRAVAVEDDPGALGPALESARSLENVLEQRELLAKILDRLMLRLTPEEQSLFRGLYVEGLDAQEVAELLGLKVNAIYQRKHRLAAKITAVIEELTS